MPSARTRWLLMAGTIFSGVLAGGVLDRIIVGRPAWQQLGIAACVEYSRYADLGAGLIAYPVEGFGAGLLLLAAAISRFIDDRPHFAPGLLVYLAVTFAIAGLVLTFKAASIMLSLAIPPSAAATLCLAGCSAIRRAV